MGVAGRKSTHGDGLHVNRAGEAPWVRTMPPILSVARHDSSMALPVVRRADLADLPDLLCFMEDFYRGEHIPWERSRFEQALAPLLVDDVLGLVGMGGEPDDAAGYAVVTWGYDLEFGGRDAFLTELYVRPGLRRAGWGTALLDWVETRARAAGAGAIHLMVLHENAAARALYEARGYAPPPRQLLSKPL